MKTRIVLIAAVGLGGSAVLAEEQVQGSLIAPGVHLTTPVGVEFLFDDNMYYSSSNEKEAFAYLIKPGAKLTMDRGANQYVLAYNGVIGEYDSSSRDDYFDHQLNGEAKLELNSKNRLDVAADYRKGHDPFGTDRTSGTAASLLDLDKWHQAKVGAQYTFGADDAPVNVKLRAALLDKEYDTNLSFTRFLDYRYSQFGVGGLYRLSPKTAAVVDYDYYDVDVKNEAAGVPSRDGDIQRVLVGARWFATAKTVGTARVGYYERNFDSGTRNKVDGTDWDVAIAWSPVSYSTFVLDSGRQIRESYFTNESFVNTEYVGLNWKHDWSSSTRSELGVSYYDTHFERLTPPDRNEDITAFTGLIKHRLTRLWGVKAGFNLSDKNSNFAGFDYDKNVIYAGVEGDF